MPERGVITCLVLAPPAGIVVVVTVTIRSIREDELPAYVESMAVSFLWRPDVDKVAADVKSVWDLERTLAAFDGDRISGTFRSWATELTVPGGARLPASAISAVTVMPTHRRRGILRDMVAAEHRAIRERGEAFGLLYASEYPIYGRFGYGAACMAATWTLDTLGTSFRGGPVTGVEVVKPGPDSRDAIKGMFDAWRLRQPGEISRRAFTWDLDLALRPSVWGPDWKGYLALHRDGSQAVDGYVRYHTDEKWDERQPRYTLTVDELHALTDEAYATLWRYLADVDWVARVKAERRSPTERLPWLLTNARAATASEVGEGMWVRLLDVPRALAARTYERDGSIVLDVVDPEASGGRTRVHLETGGNGATCQPTDDPPDLTLHVAALGAAYLGGTRLRDAVLADGVDEHRTGALREADASFRTLDEPWCSTSF
jgi:predicted acetyltransferase